VHKLLDQRDKTPYQKPVTMRAGTPAAELLHVMNERGIRQIPLLDESGRWWTSRSCKNWSKAMSFRSRR